MTDEIGEIKRQRVRVIEEPVATALAYLNRSSLKYAFVYDLGGGTFDAAVVDCSRYPFRVVGHGGDPYLGGDDVDWHAIGSALELSLGRRILRVPVPAPLVRLAGELMELRRRWTDSSPIPL